MLIKIFSFTRESNHYINIFSRIWLHLLFSSSNCAPHQLWSDDLLSYSHFYSAFYITLKLDFMFFTYYLGQDIAGNLWVTTTCSVIISSHNGTEWEEQQVFEVPSIPVSLWSCDHSSDAQHSNITCQLPASRAYGKTDRKLEVTIMWSLLNTSGNPCMTTGTPRMAIIKYAVMWLYAILLSDGVPSPSLGIPVIQRLCVLIDSLVTLSYIFLTQTLLTQFLIYSSFHLYYLTF